MATWIDSTRGLAEISRFCGLLNYRDPRFVDRLVDKQKAAAERLRREGYAIAQGLPKHPAAPGLLAYRRILAGDDDANLRSQILPVILHALSVNAFAADWNGQEAWLAPRLRDPQQYLTAVFEMETALYFQSTGNRVEYVAPKRQNQGGPDLIIHVEEGVEVDIECTLADRNAGLQIRSDQTAELVRQVFTFMKKRNCHRLVHIHCTCGFRSGDTQPLSAAIRTRLREDTLGRFSVLDGTYDVDISNGGTPVYPLTLGDLQTIMEQASRSPLRWGKVQSATAVPSLQVDRYLVQGITISSSLPNDSLASLIRSALAKSRTGQVNTSRPGIIVAGFGRSVLESQVLSPEVRLALERKIVPELRLRVGVSALVLSFRTGWDTISSMTGAATNYDGGVTAFYWINDHPKARPIPSGFRWPRAPWA